MGCYPTKHCDLDSFAQADPKGFSKALADTMTLHGSSPPMLMSVFGLRVAEHKTVNFMSVLK